MRWLFFEVLEHWVRENACNEPIYFRNEILLSLQQTASLGWGNGQRWMIFGGHILGWFIAYPTDLNHRLFSCEIDIFAKLETVPNSLLTISIAEHNPTFSLNSFLKQWGCYQWTQVKLSLLHCGNVLTSTLLTRFSRIYYTDWIEPKCGHDKQVDEDRYWPHVILTPWVGLPKWMRPCRIALIDVFWYRRSSDWKYGPWWKVDHTEITICC